LSDGLKPKPFAPSRYTADNRPTFMKQLDSRRLRQFQLRHLLGLTTAAAVLFAALAPTIRQLDREAQLHAVVRAVVLAILILGFLGYLIFMRQKIEHAAGPVIERFESFSSRVWNWLIGSLLWIGYVGSLWAQYQSPQTVHDANFLPGYPTCYFSRSTISWFAVGGESTPRASWPASMASS
jgi:hypothetical protein